VHYLESQIQEKLAAIQGEKQERAQSGSVKSDGPEGEENLLMLSATATATQEPQTGDVSLPTISILSLSNIGDSSESGPFTFSKVLSTIIRSDGRNPACSTKSNPFFADLADAIPHALPDMASQLSGNSGRRHLDKYFKVVQFRYPCVDQEEVEDYYKVWVGQQTDKTQARQESPVKNFIIYMVIAIGIALDEESAAHSSFFSSHFLFAAIRHFEAVLEGAAGSTDDPIDIIRALLLLAIYSLYSPSAGPTWHFIGLAIRKAVCMGYNMELPGDDHESVREKRRWVFWSAYVLDRCVCQALGRPLSIQDSDVTAQVCIPLLSFLT